MCVGFFLRSWVYLLSSLFPSCVLPHLFLHVQELRAQSSSGVEAALQSVKASEAVCPNCNEPGRPEFVSEIAEDSPLATEPLSRVGIPPYDIVKVDGAAVTLA